MESELQAKSFTAAITQEAALLIEVITNPSENYLDVTYSLSLSLSLSLSPSLSPGDANGFHY